MAVAVSAWTYILRTRFGYVVTIQHSLLEFRWSNVPKSIVDDERGVKGIKVERSGRLNASSVLDVKVVFSIFNNEISRTSLLYFSN